MSADVWSKVTAFRAAADGRARGLYPFFRAFDVHEGPEAVIEGRRVTMFGSNNYLGLTTHPKVREAAREAVRRLGTSTTGSRLINGTLRLHEELEQRLAAFLGRPSALVFTTGYQVNLAVCSALLAEGNVAVVDRGVHASIYDGVRLATSSGARMVRFGHNSASSLHRHLSRLDDGEGALVMMDGVFSADGVVARLDEIVPVIRAHRARVMIDDAHGLGMLGPGGRGTVHHFGLESEVDLIGGTFSKSLASVGGYLVGDEAVIDYIRHNASPFIFAASGAPATLAAALAALEVMQEETWRIDRLRENSEYMARGLRLLGFDIGATTTAIIPILIGDEERTVEVWRDLLESHAIYTNPFLFSSVAAGGALLRTSCMATHEQGHLDRGLEAFEAVGRKHGLI
ncbi:MAG TPA: aminotransferase class I/II-fold pyridoxal phosphate-dependent enzyme [Longimicrobiales bacterium]|nr:aminotransferase class I/II-fold pyridoxal phosphate-dependent enzyme [Longimicrobiales bacterium]